MGRWKPKRKGRGVKKRQTGLGRRKGCHQTGGGVFCVHRAVPAGRGRSCSGSTWTGPSLTRRTGRWSRGCVGSIPPRAPRGERSSLAGLWPHKDAEEWRRALPPRPPSAAGGPLATSSTSRPRGAVMIAVIDDGESGLPPSSQSNNGQAFVEHWVSTARPTRLRHASDALSLSPNPPPRGGALRRGLPLAGGGAGPGSH